MSINFNGIDFANVSNDCYGDFAVSGASYFL
jgi:hypothetical protein